jgi:hypothetical protein
MRSTDTFGTNFYDRLFITYKRTNTFCIDVYDTMFIMREMILFGIDVNNTL